MVHFLLSIWPPDFKFPLLLFPRLHMLFLFFLWVYYLSFCLLFCLLLGARKYVSIGGKKLKQFNEATYM